MPQVDLTKVAIELSDVEREALEGVDDVTGADEPLAAGGDGSEATPPAASTPAVDEPPSSGPTVPDPASTDEPAAAAVPSPAADDAPAPDSPPAAAAPAPADETIPKLRLPEIQPAREIPADLDEQIKGVDEQIAALDKRYFDDGEIEAREYQKQIRLINDRRADLLGMKQESAIVARTNEATRTAAWANAQEKFFDDNTSFRNPVMHGALDAALRQLYADPKYAGADYGFLLNKAAESVRSAIGVTTPPASAAAQPAVKPAVKQTPAAAAATARADKAKATIKEAPKTLGGLPAAEPNTADGDEFSHLDNLAGMDLEHALSRMTPEQEQRYLQRMG